MRITITCEIYDEFSDPDHEMGVTNEGYERILDGLRFCDDIEVTKADA